MQLLQEMNPDVCSDYLDESVDNILSNNPEFFYTFKVVIATSLKEKTLISLSRLLWAQNIPFVYYRSVGFIASARVQYREHFVVETHPDNKQFDLRLELPFDILERYLEVNQSTPFFPIGISHYPHKFLLQTIELSHKVPWIVVVYRFLKRWQGITGKTVPTNYTEKCELKKMIEAGKC